MKKLISALANIPFSVLSQHFPGAPMYFYALKTLASAFICKGGYRTLVAMDLKTHACSFNCEQPIRITKVGYRAWKAGITYRICLWQCGRVEPLSSCLVCPENTDEIQFFSLKRPVHAYPDSNYYISRTYIKGGPHHNMKDYIGWLSNKEGDAVFPVKENVITLSNGFFSDEMNPVISNDMSDITTNSLLPILDFEYTLSV